MSTNTVISQGTTLTIAVSGGSATPVLGFKDFSGIGGGTATIIDASDLASAAKEKQIGLIDEGSVKFSLNYIDADPGQVAMETARAGRVAGAFVVTLSTGTKYSFTGYVQTFEKSASVDQIVGIAATVEITGLVTKTAHS